MDIEAGYRLLKYYTVKMGMNAWMHAEPGVGKTTLVDRLEWETKVPVLRFPPAVSMDPVDIRGIPSLVQLKDRQATTWNLADFIPTDPHWDGIIFVDEVAQAPTSVQATLLQITGPPYRIGMIKMPVNARWVFAGNRREDRAGVNALITPLLNRFKHIDIEPDAARLCAYLRKRNIPGAEIGARFLEFCPDLVSTFKPNEQQRAFASGRQWEEVCPILADPPDDDLFFDALAGALGAGVASQIIGWLEIQRGLKPVPEMLQDPDGCPVPTKEEPSTCFAVVQALTAHCKTTPADCVAAVRIVLRLPRDYAAKAMGDLLAINPAVRQSVEFQAFRKQYGNLFQD